LAGKRKSILVRTESIDIVSVFPTYHLIPEPEECGRRVLCAQRTSAQTIFVFFLGCVYCGIGTHHHYH